ncbi:methionine aminopeptidase, type I [Synechococcus sp. PCC 7335]|uniref:type I methionyl aminopeptidase n=1 Tax=Synechococcus sp. (strain ATCC 29403 / PCC 7335) TaxID=91464 RepID=UPI00017EB442|nr:type I methionyl aminopeptidase [Synechococcus sp. PCC 7335]EDX86188.1 methionine aminopeptidase, type I [Synechococcus sp. PCC 7335]
MSQSTVLHNSNDAPFRGITLLSERELEAMRPACRLSCELLDFLTPMVVPGVSTLELNDAAESWTRQHGATSAPLGYPGARGAIDFPKSICTSINEVVCHGIPSEKDILQEGDIINIDVTPLLNGYHGDSSRTFMVGEVSPTARKLVEVTEKSLWKGIEAVKVGGRIGDIGAAIQAYAESEGFAVVRDFVGHGVHRIFHAEPQVPHYGVAGKGKKIRPGMVFTIEPMLNEGTHEVELLEDQWTAVTRDGMLSAQFEHTLAVTKSGVEVLTKMPAAVLA